MRKQFFWLVNSNFLLNFTESLEIGKRCVQNETYVQKSKTWAEIITVFGSRCTDMHNTHKNKIIIKKPLILHCHTCSFPGIHERQLSKLTLLDWISVVSPVPAIWTCDFSPRVTLWHVEEPSNCMVHTMGQCRHCDSGCHLSGGQCGIWRWRISQDLLPDTNSRTDGDELFHLFPPSTEHNLFCCQVHLGYTDKDFAKHLWPCHSVFKMFTEFQRREMHSAGK